MLTPAFELSQDDANLIICIKVPYAKTDDMNVYFEDNEFAFHCKPYYLRLNLPGRVVYEAEPTVSYDFDQGTLTIWMKKVNRGEQFENLDLLTKLLAPKGKPSSSSPLIEIIGDSNCGEENCEEEIDEIDWFIEQSPADDNDVLFLGNPTCGFANLHSCCVFKLKEETSEIFDLADPEMKPAHVLREERLLAESKQFCYEHYLADLYQDEEEEIQSCLAFSPDWDDLHKEIAATSCNPDEIVHFTSEENERLISLPNKEYLVDKTETQMLYFGLVDIIFAYAYDKRTTFGEQTVESAWTINKLSSTLTWLEKFTSLSAVVHSCVRRSLCYPLYRHWALAMTVLKDTRKILSLGRKYVLKCLLEIHELFCSSDPRYILNDLYITDYCVWIQSKRCETEVFLTLAEALGKVKVTKEDMDLDLVEFEQGAELAMQEQNFAATLPPSVSVERDSSESCLAGFTTESSNSTCDSASHSFSSSSQEKISIETITSRLEGISVSDEVSHTTEAGFSQSTSSGSSSARSESCTSNEHTHSSPHVVIHMPALDPTLQDSDDSSESGSCSDSCSETDSDDYSTSSDSYSDDSDADSTLSNNSNEHSRLLKQEKCCERRR